MTTTIAFDLVTQLVVKFKATAPADVQVYDGEGDSQDPGNFLMVGVGDPLSDSDTDAVSGTQEWSGLGAKASRESGTVTCCALAWSGDSGSDAQQAAREKVRDIVVGIDASLKADPNLGGTVPGLMWVRYGQTYRLTQPPIDGSLAIFEFEIAYEARLV